MSSTSFICFFGGFVFVIPDIRIIMNKTRLLKNYYRATAIMYMRRAGLPWETIIKITGHKSTANLVKFYDLKLEAQGI